MKRMRKVTLGFLMVGFLLFVLLVYQVGLGVVVGHLRLLGWRLPLILLPYTLAYLLFTLGWKAVLQKDIPLLHLFLIREAGEAMNSLTLSASLGGEPVKAYLLRSYEIPLEKGLTSVVVTKTAMTLSQMTFTILGIILATRQIGAKGPLLTFSITLALAWIPAMAFFIVLQRQGLFTTLLLPAKALSLFKTRLARWEDRIRSLDRQIATFYTRDARSFVLSCGLHLSGWMVQSLEVYLLLSFLELPVDLPTAFAIQGLSVLTKAAAFVIPGALGAQEGGNLLIFLGFSLPMEAGMTFSLVRRGRELFWISLGLAMLARYGLKRIRSEVG